MICPATLKRVEHEPVVAVRVVHPMPSEFARVGNVAAHRQVEAHGTVVRWVRHNLQLLAQRTCAGCMSASDLLLHRMAWHGMVLIHACLVEQASEHTHALVASDMVIVPIREQPERNSIQYELAFLQAVGCASSFRVTVSTHRAKDILWNFRNMCNFLAYTPSL